MRKFGFAKPSWKRALGISAAKGKISRAIGVPLTKSGRERKFGRLGAKFLWPFGIAKAGLLKSQRPVQSIDRDLDFGQSPFGVARSQLGFFGRVGLLFWSLFVLFAAFVVGVGAYFSYANGYGLLAALLGLIGFWLLIRFARNAARACGKG